jgi:hypothetical protein
MRHMRLVAGAMLVFVSSCSRPAENPSTATNQPASGPRSLIGEPITPVVSVKELMKYMIDPVSDNIFDAVWWDTTKAGVVKHEPKTEDDWDRVRTGAVSLAEGIELLKVPRPWTPPGDVNNSTGPNPPELSPTEIQAKLEKDPVFWEAKIQALRNAALEVVEVAKKKDVSALFSASADVDEACEACHLEYWYPGDAAVVREWKNGKVTFGKPAAAPSHK